MLVSELFILYSYDSYDTFRYHKKLYIYQSPNFLTFKEPKNWFQETNSARLFSLVGRYDTPIPTQFLAYIDGLKIPAQDWADRFPVGEIYSMGWSKVTGV